MSILNSYSFYFGVRSTVTNIDKFLSLFWLHCKYLLANCISNECHLKESPAKGISKAPVDFPKIQRILWHVRSISYLKTDPSSKDSVRWKKKIRLEADTFINGQRKWQTIFRVNWVWTMFLGINMQLRFTHCWLSNKKMTALNHRWSLKLKDVF